MLQAIIFDFDGLIIDTETPVFEAWSEIYQSHGFRLEPMVWAQCIGRGVDSVIWSPYDHLEELLGEPIDREALLETKRRRYEELMAGSTIRPGVEHCIQEAKRLGIKLAVASSSSHEWVEGHLSKFGLLPHFDCLRCFDDVVKTKPDPELYLAALAGLEIASENAIAIEDSPNGVLAAKGADLYCIAVPNAITCYLSLEHADLQLSSLTELTLERLPHFTSKIPINA